CTAATAAQTAAATTGNPGPLERAVGSRPIRGPRRLPNRYAPLPDDMPLGRQEHAVLELEHALHPGGEIGIVRHDDEARAERRVELEQQVEDPLPGRTV